MLRLILIGCLHIRAVPLTCLRISLLLSVPLSVVSEGGLQVCSLHGSIPIGLSCLALASQVWVQDKILPLS